MRSIEELPRQTLELGPSGRRWGWVSIAVGVVFLGATWVLSGFVRGGAERVLHAYLVNYAFFLSLSLGALFFIMVTHLTRAGWSVALRRLAEGVAAPLLPMALLVVPIFARSRILYEWADAAEVAHDPLLQHKSAYLNEPFFALRLALYFLVWLGLSAYFLRRSARQDRSGDPVLSLRMESVSAPGLILFAFSVTFAAFDLLMSLTPHWYSAVFGVYYFSGAAVGFFALLTVIVLLLHRTGRLREAITVEHYHDLGKLTFAFVVFWAYIAFSQYMLIWYGNLPEETSWYHARQEGQWLWISLLLLFGHFLIPFVALISKHPKRRPLVLTLLSIWVLVMHWWDVYWLVVPSVSPGRVPLGPADLTCLLGLGGVFAGTVLLRFARHALLPVKDPRIAESLELESV